MATRVLFLALIVTLAASGVAFAETAAETATSWGLVGLWRLDCGTPASRDDVDLRYVVRDGALFHERNWGDGQDSSPVISATLTPQGGIDVVLKLESMSQTREFIVAKVDADHTRTVMSRNVDTNEYSIRDGTFISDGRPVRPLARCR